MKLIGLLLTIFLSGYTFGVNAANETIVEEAVCPSIQDKNFIKEKIMAFEPPRRCPQYDAELSFDENLYFCGRTKLRLHNI
jgi:hypothetical protein